MATKDTKDEGRKKAVRVDDKEDRRRKERKHMKVVEKKDKK